jgi:hypothetical protein
LKVLKKLSQNLDYGQIYPCYAEFLRGLLSNFLMTGVVGFARNPVRTQVVIFAGILSLPYRMEFRRFEKGLIQKALEDESHRGYDFLSLFFPLNPKLSSGFLKKKAGFREKGIFRQSVQLVITAFKGF